MRRLERIVVLLIAGALLAGQAAGGWARPARGTPDGPPGPAALESPAGPVPAGSALRDRHRPSQLPLAWLGLGCVSSAGPMPPVQAADSAGPLRAARSGPGSLVALHVQITI